MGMTIVEIRPIDDKVMIISHPNGIESGQIKKRIIQDDNSIKYSIKLNGERRNVYRSHCNVFDNINELLKYYKTKFK